MKRLDIAGAIAAALALQSTSVLAADRPIVVLSRTPSAGQHSFSGTLLSRRHLVLTIRLRTGQLLVVDATQAYLRDRVTQPLEIGELVTAQGDLIAGVLIANSAVATHVLLPRSVPNR
jgi:hypothetical protein